MHFAASEQGLHSVHNILERLSGRKSVPIHVCPPFMQCRWTNKPFSKMMFALTGMNSLRVSKSCLFSEDTQYEAKEKINGKVYYLESNYIYLISS